jgi:hypothetical protein
MLNYNLKKIKDFNELNNGTTETIIWATMAIGMGKITKDNYMEFFKRLEFYERLNGPMRRVNTEGGYQPLYFKPEEVKRYIGLDTNVAHEPLSKWVLRVYRNFVNHI